MENSKANNTAQQFDDIEAYSDNHFVEYWKKLCKDPQFKRVVNLLSVRFTWLKERISKVNSLEQLHSNILHQLMKYFTDKTISQFTVSGVENLPITGEGAKGAIYISNHRSIALDPLLLNFVLYEHMGKTAHSAFGDNLLGASWFANLMRLNGGFVVKRNFNDLDQKITEVDKLSRYIKNLLDNGQSIWIAQRNGRAKDGNDLTDSVVPTMLKYAHEHASWEEFTSDFPIIPVSVSYEEIPLDVLMIRDQLRPKRKTKDRTVIMRELMRKKRAIHIHISERVYAKKRSELVQELDKRIISGLKIWDSNESAYRAVMQKNTKGLVQWLKGKLVFCNPQIREMLLRLYANPCINRLKFRNRQTS